MFDAFSNADTTPRTQNSEEWWKDSGYDYATQSISGAFYNVRLFKPLTTGSYAIWVIPNSGIHGPGSVPIRENLYGIGGYSVDIADVTNNADAARHISQVGFI
jgi:hypothetical protein